MGQEQSHARARQPARERAAEFAGRRRDHARAVTEAETALAAKSSIMAPTDGTDCRRRISSPRSRRRPTRQRPGNCACSFAGWRWRNVSGEFGSDAGEDGGNCFWIRLPRATARMKTLVLIESDALTRTLISECLTGKDWCVLEAEDGQAGLDLVLKHRPTAVLCDLRTPKRNGLPGLPRDSRRRFAQAECASFSRR